MQLSGLRELLRSTPAYAALRNQLQMGLAVPDLGILRSARPFLAMTLAADLGRPLLYITGRTSRAYNIAEQLPVWDQAVDVLRFAEPGPLFYERAPWSDTTIRNRLQTLAALCPPPLEQRTTAPVVRSWARARARRSQPASSRRRRRCIPAWRPSSRRRSRGRIEAGRHARA